MKKYDLALLTHLRNGSEEEDILLSRLLPQFNLRRTDLAGIEAIEDTVDGVLIRNKWPDVDGSAVEYYAASDAVYDRLRRKGIHTYNPLTCKGDMAGKDYIPKLYQSGYPVIPTVEKSALSQLPSVERYVAKPRRGFTGKDQITGSKDDIIKQAPADYLIQPFMPFTEEVQFYFIDSDFIYALATPNRRQEAQMRLYAPSRDEIDVAARFIEWNNVPHALQRVDFCRMPDKNLLLMELEDDAPYLWLEELPPDLQASFTRRLASSMMDYFGKL
jgi:hypothetical protein